MFGFYLKKMSFQIKKKVHKYKWPLKKSEDSSTLD